MNKQFNSDLSAGAGAEQSDAADATMSSQPIGNTDVVGSQCQPFAVIEGLEIFKGCKDKQVIALKKKAIVQALRQIGLCHAFEF